MTRTHPYTGISIEFPGKRHGVYNTQSEPFAEQIVEHWHREGGDFVSLKQPWGGKYIAGEDGYTELADAAMPPYVKGIGVTNTAFRAAATAKKRHMTLALYSGAAWALASGNCNSRDVRWMEPRDLDDIADACAELAETFEGHADYYFLDDMGKLLAYLGMPTDKNWSDPMIDEARKGGNPEKFRIRKDYPGPKRWKTAVKDIFEAHQRGLHSIDDSIIVGVEPDPRAQGRLVEEWLPTQTPFMVVCDPPSIDTYPPNDTDRLAFLILNNVAGDFTLADYLAWKRKANELGYSTIVTWWVWRVLMRRAGIEVPGGG